MKEFVLDCLNEDNIVVNELLNIDNKIQFKSFSINDLVNIINSININTLDDYNEYVFITDGELKTVLTILFNCYPNIKIININNKNVAIIKWFIMVIKKYYMNNGLDYDVILDIDNNYSKYDNENNIVICGSKLYYNYTRKYFSNKSLIDYIIE